MRKFSRMRRVADRAVSQAAATGDRSPPRSTMSLATVDQAGKPHAANLYFAPDDRLNLYFVSDAKSAHCRHVASRPDVAGTAYAPVRMWQQIKGVQFHGKCEPIDAGEWALVWKVYLEGLRFPKEDASRSAWWSLWRRIAGGLPGVSLAAGGGGQCQKGLVSAKARQSGIGCACLESVSLVMGTSN